MNFQLSETKLFSGTTENEAQAMLECLSATSKKYKKGEIIYHAGATISHVGMVLSGSVHIENNDVFGNKTILSHVGPGEIFGETYACIPGEPLMVDAVVAEDATVLFLDVVKILQTCSASCTHHKRLINNLLQICAQKSLQLSRRILHTSSKSIRGRLISYFSELAQKSSSTTFILPFNRQQLADYLSVDRSAMSNELSKMKADGLIDYDKHTVTIKEKLADV